MRYYILCLTLSKIIALWAFFCADSLRPGINILYGIFDLIKEITRFATANKNLIVCEAVGKRNYKVCLLDVDAANRLGFFRASCQNRNFPQTAKTLQSAICRKIEQTAKQITSETAKITCKALHKCFTRQWMAGMWQTSCRPFLKRPPNTFWWKIFRFFAAQK